MLEVDVRLFRLLNASLTSSPALVSVMAALTVLGSGWSMAALVPLLVRSRTRRFGAGLALTLTATAAVVFLVKQLVGRARPCAGLVRARVFEAPTDPSFPSGHAAGSFAFAAFVAWLIVRDPARATVGWRLVAASLFVLATGVALSRVALGVHFPLDVAAGAVVGALVGIAGGHVHSRRTPHFGRSDSGGK